jgi:4'-phosphopantetheinyl transferase EntD
MRTTLDLDPTALSAARAKAKAEHISLGRAVSELVLAALKSPQSPHSTTASGFPVLAGVPGHVVTDELVTSHRDDEPEHGEPGDGDAA